MRTKFVIFVVVSALFVASIYSISSSIVYASTTDCAKQGKVTKCVVYDGGDVSFWTCAKNPDGKTYHCEEDKTKTSPPPELNTAINDAMVKGHSGAIGGGATTGENNTHITNGNIVKSGGSLKGGDTTGSNESTRNGNTNCMHNCTLQ